MDSKERINTTPQPREAVHNASWRMMEALTQQPDILFERVKSSMNKDEFDRLCAFIKERLEGVRTNDGKEIALLDTYHNIFKEMLHEKQYVPGDPIEHIDEKYGALMVALQDMAKKG